MNCEIIQMQVFPFPLQKRKKLFFSLWSMEEPIGYWERSHLWAKRIQIFFSVPFPASSHVFVSYLTSSESTAYIALREIDEPTAALKMHGVPSVLRF